MFNLPKKLRDHLISKYKLVKSCFNDENHLIDLLHQGIPINHFLILQRLRRLDLNKIKDIELVMLSGAFSFTFSAGSYPYSCKENIAINELGDAILELKHYK